MLVLSRKQGEQIRIGSEIEVVVLEVTKGRVRIGISAPTEIPIRRQELVQRLRREQCNATQVESQQELEPSVVGHQMFYSKD